MYAEATEVFCKLSKYPPTLDDGDMEVLEKFVVTMYDRSSTTSHVNDARLNMFVRKQRPYDAIPPTSATGLHEHVKRAVYVASCIWSQSTLSQSDMLSPADWGWTLSGDVWQILWTTLHPLLTDNS